MMTKRIVSAYVNSFKVKMCVLILVEVQSLFVWIMKPADYAFKEV